MELYVGIAWGLKSVDAWIPDPGSDLSAGGEQSEPWGS